MRPSLLKSAAILGVSALLTASAGLSASAQAPDRPKHPKTECFDKDFVTGFSSPNEDTVYVRVSSKEIWRLDLFTSCPDVDWRQSVGIKTHGTSFVCSGLDIELIVPNHGMGPNRCMVRSIHKMTQAEIDALPKRDRP